jgi:hypothetical protein
MMLGQHHMVGFKVLRNFSRAVVKVYNLCRVKTDRSAVLTVKSGLYPHMIIKHKDGINSWFPHGFEIRCFPKWLSGLV